MALSPRQQLQTWGAAAAAGLVALWLMGDILLPFVIGGAVAYFLDPVADWLERRGLSRALAVSLITLLAVLGLALALLLVLPTLLAQAAALAQQAPVLLGRLEASLAERFPALDGMEPIIQRSLGSLTDLIRARGGDLLGGVLVSARSLVGLLAFALIVPVVTFYLLLDWDRMIARADALLPREHAPTIRRLAREVDATLAGFLRGQGTVMLIVGAYYALALMIAGLDYGLVVGAVAGLVSFIPYVGAIVGGGLAMGLALFQFWGEWGVILVVAAIFLSGQVLEGNVLTPKLVGGSVGLHPVWLLLALSAFGAAFGLIGLLAAVPIAAALGVIARFAVERYHASALYLGPHGRPAGPAGAPEPPEAPEAPEVAARPPEPAPAAPHGTTPPAAPPPSPPVPPAPPRARAAPAARPGRPPGRPRRAS